MSVETVWKIASLVPLAFLSFVWFAVFTVDKPPKAWWQYVLVGWISLCIVWVLGAVVLL